MMNMRVCSNVLPKFRDYIIGLPPERSLSYLGKEMPYGSIVVFFFVTISIEIVSDTDIQSLRIVMISALVVMVTSALIISGPFSSYFGCNIYDRLDLLQ